MFVATSRPAASPANDGQPRTSQKSRHSGSDAGWPRETIPLCKRSYRSAYWRSRKTESANPAVRTESGRSAALCVSETPAHHPDESTLAANHKGVPDASVSPAPESPDQFPPHPPAGCHGAMPLPHRSPCPTPRSSRPDSARQNETACCRDSPPALPSSNPDAAPEIHPTDSRSAGRTCGSPAWFPRRSRRPGYAQACTGFADTASTQLWFPDQLRHAAAEQVEQSGLPPGTYLFVNSAETQNPAARLPARSPAAASIG